METVKDVAASVCGAFSCVYTGQPLDTIKVRMQVAPHIYPSLWQCLKRSITTDGVTSLWRGAFPAFLGAVGENAMAFGVNGYLTRLNLDEHFHPHLTPYINGMITGVCAAIVLCPSDVIKCKTQMARMEAEALNTSTPTTAMIARQLLTSHGLKGVFKGLPYQCARDGFFYTFFFGSYDILAKQLQNAGVSDELSYFLSGGFSGQLAWVFALPFDTMKSMVQTSTTKTPTLTEMIKTRGIRGLYRGFSVVLLRAFPANAALFLGYETSRNFLG